MTFPKVTVLVTVKNSEQNIEKCVNSLLKLNYPNYKIYITDAFSTDKTYEILKKIQSKYPKKIKIEQIRGNISKALNYMIKKVKSEFIAITDADCVVDKNWLKNLILGFDSNEIISTAGFCSTKKNVNKLQRLIGLELENRFKHFPKFITRAPTMNFCVKTYFAKKVKFDERLDVAQETDWGYRLTKLGKIKYVPNAVVYHYHRTELKSYFKQQFEYGKNVPLVYLIKHRNKIIGDHISTPTVFFQLLFFNFNVLLFLISIFFRQIVFQSFLFFIFLLSFYLFDIIIITKSPKEILSLLFIYFFRVTAWTLGIAVGLIKLLLNR
jgi:cellulose synthase/poly-beta-1,6-N-acetylglucosamine synthase-like glycosyltransferase